VRIYDEIERGGVSGSVITPEGIWLGQGWMRMSKGGADEQGVIKREQQVRDLESELSHPCLLEQQDLLPSLRQ